MGDDLELRTTARHILLERQRRIARIDPVVDPLSQLWVAVSVEMNHCGIILDELSCRHYTQYKDRLA
jgi:hypothetical protein